MAKIYWRTIKRGARTFDSIPDSIKEDVITLAKQDVLDGVITEEEYKELIGEDYAA